MLLEKLEDLELKIEINLLKLINSKLEIFVNLKRVHIFISGKVQGVYFRQSMKETAEKNNVKGWVKNLPDKRVEAVLEGEDSNIDAVIDWSRFGPPGAMVEDLKILNENSSKELLDFEIIP